MRTGILIAVLVMATAAACGGPPAHRTGYWTPRRELNAQPWGGAEPSAGPPSAWTDRRAPRVGAIFVRNGSSDHFCTASVVDSPRRDLLITAAHCIHGGKGSRYASDIVFIPAYRDGAAPYGVWTPVKLVVDPRWISSSDPDLDVGFVVLAPRDGKNIQDVLGANRLAFDAGFDHTVRVTGYPTSSSEPVTCVNKTSRQSSHQLRFACAGFVGGTSGSPWLSAFDPVTRTGTIIGVIGGYQEGGDSDSVSYSAYLDHRIERLYRQAGG